MFLKSVLPASGRYIHQQTQKKQGQNMSGRETSLPNLRCGKAQDQIAGLEIKVVFLESS